MNNTVESPAETTLIKVALFYRHGERSSVLPLSMPGIDQPDWHGDPGQLTKVGMRNCYSLGKRLRSRYDAILGRDYSKNVYSAKSTCFDRNVMSASVLSAGLYPPTENTSWSSELPWVPIPISVDNSFLKYFSHPRILYEYLVLNLDEMDKRFAKAVVLFEEEIGYKFQNREIPAPELYKFFDILVCLRSHGVSLGKLWTEFLEENEPLFYEWFKYLISNTTVQKQLASSVFKETLFDFIDSQQRFLTVSAHDVTIQQLTTILGLELKSWPLCTSGVAIEFHERTGEQFVKLFYIESANGLMTPFKMNGKVDCSLADFKENLLKWQPDDLDALGSSVPEELKGFDVYSNFVIHLSPKIK